MTPIKQRMNHHCSRREFLATFAPHVLAASRPQARRPAARPRWSDHRHHHNTNYSFRTDEHAGSSAGDGRDPTILLPAGALYHLEGNCTGNEAGANFAWTIPCEYFSVPRKSHRPVPAEMEIISQSWSDGHWRKKFPSSTVISWGNRPHLPFSKTGGWGVGGTERLGRTQSCPC